MRLKTDERAFCLGSRVRNVRMRVWEDVGIVLYVRGCGSVDVFRFIGDPQAKRLSIFSLSLSLSSLPHRLFAFPFLERRPFCLLWKQIVL